jgi:hypothetical protein
LEESKNEKPEIRINQPCYGGGGGGNSLFLFLIVTALSLPVFAGCAGGPAAVSYEIGDTGPSGGIIFYVRPTYASVITGVFTVGGILGDNWKYLEAMPEDLGRTIPFGETFAGDLTKAEIGSGKENTRIFIEKYKEYSEEWRAKEEKNKTAVWFFSGLEGDWYLPSTGELKLLYENLHKNGLGGFTDGRYWSSTYGYNGHRSFDFGSGEEQLEGAFTDQKRYVRAVRRF